MEMSSDKKRQMEKPGFFFDLMHEDALPPEKAHEGDAAWDLFNPFPITIEHHSQVMVDTLVVFEFPPEFVMLVQGKSGLAQLGITTIGNVIDSSYRGTVNPILVNLSDRDIHFVKNEKIAQIMFVRISAGPLERKPTKEMSKTTRGTGGHGSSGSKPKKIDKDITS